MLRKNRLKPLKDGIGENDASPLLVKIGGREQSRSFRRKGKGLQWDDGSTTEQPTTPMKGKAKKMMIKVKNTSSQPLVEKLSFAQRLSNTSMDISSIMPHYTSSTSTESDNSLPEMQTSQRSAQKIHPEKGRTRKLSGRKKSAKFINLEKEEVEEPLYNSNTFSPHFPITSGDEALERISYINEFSTQENRTKGILSAFIEDKSWVKTVDEGSIATNGAQSVDMDSNEEDSTKYHEFISEAVVLRLQKDKATNHGKMKYGSFASSSCGSSIMSETSTVVNARHTSSPALNEEDFYVNFDSTEDIVIDQQQQPTQSEPETDIYGFHQEESVSRKGILPKPDFLQNGITINETKNATTKPALEPRKKETSMKLEKTDEKMIDTSDHELSKSGGKRPSKIEAFVSRISNKKSCDKGKQEFLKTESPFDRGMQVQDKIQDKKATNAISAIPYDHETTDTSLISICLLSLNGNAEDASSRLQSGLIIGGRRNSQSDREYLQRMGCTDEYGYIVLENITSVADDNENVQSWKAMVPIDKNVYESSSGHGKEKFRLGMSKDAKSQTATLLMNGDFNEAAELLQDNLENERTQTGIFTWANIGSIQLWQGNYADALISFEAATEYMDGTNASRDARSLALLGMALYGEKKFEEANQAYLRALTMLRTKTKKGYGCYTHRHDFVMGQIFNCVGCSFYETGFHKSATRSFLNALHIYLQDIFTSGLSAEESQSVEFLLRTVKVNKDWTSHVPPPFILDTAITFSNLACVLSNKNNLALAISCLRLSLKLQMTTDESMIDRDTMIATLEELGHTYKKFKHGQDAEHVFGIILRTGRDKFSNACTFHRTMFRASMVMKELKASIQDFSSVTKYDELAQYHHDASLDAVKIEGICKTVREQKQKYYESEGEDDDESFDKSSFDSSPTSSAGSGSDTTSSSHYNRHTMSFE